MPTLRSITPIRFNNQCPGRTITAIYYNTIARIQIVFTRTKKLYFIKKTGGIRYGPVPSSNYFPHITKPIDAAYNTRSSGNRDRTIFFVGNQ